MKQGFILIAIGLGLIGLADCIHYSRHLTLAGAYKTKGYCNDGGKWVKCADIAIIHHPWSDK